MLDDYTIQFQAKQPYFLHLSVLGSIESCRSTFTARAISIATFRGPRWERAVRAQAVGYGATGGNREAGGLLGREAVVNEIHYKFITDNNAALQLLRRGELDEMRLSAEQWVRHAPRPDIADNYQRITMYSPVDGYAGTFGWIGWNAKRPFFSDNRVRKAMTMLLDRDTIGETIYHGLVRTVSGSMFPDSPAYDRALRLGPSIPSRRRGSWRKRAGRTATATGSGQGRDALQFPVDFPDGLAGVRAACDGVQGRA